jgi:AcrR family transcriptional regulator
VVRAPDVQRWRLSHPSARDAVPMSGTKKPKEKARAPRSSLRQVGPQPLARPAPPKASEDTKARILDAALALFQKRGFDKTTMRDIAAASELSLGAAYYYYPSKEAIVFAYYEYTQDEHKRQTRAAYQKTNDLRERLGAAMHSRIRIISRDKKLLGALFRSVGDPDDELSVFSAKSAALRDAGIAIFDEALEGQALSGDLRPLLARALWVLELGIVLYFIHDRSPKHQKTTALIDGALDLGMELLPVLSLPFAAPARERLRALLVDAGLTLE